MRAFFLSIALPLLLYFGGIAYLTEGFSLSKIDHTPLHVPSFEVKNPSKEELERFVSQPYFYLGQGSQCYVFKSADKRYILKLFRFSRYRVPDFLKGIQKERALKKQLKLHHLFESCTLAFRELKEETALLYLHINSTDDLHRDVRVYDALKRSFDLPLDTTSFYIQKSGEGVFPYLSKLLDSNQSEEAERAFKNLVHLVEKRIEKGIFDEDSVLHKNAGFCEGEPIFWDIGGFVKSEIANPKQEVEKVTHTVATWFSQKLSP